MKKASVCALAPLVLFVLSGCGIVGDKTANLSSVYIITAVIAFAVLVCYFFLAKKKDPWYLLLFSSVLLANIGYVLLSVSPDLDSALAANRVAYLGSVFLPFSMLMITLKTARIKCRRWVVVSLLAISGVVFLVAASPGYLNIYYKEVSPVMDNGVCSLNKVYGPLHFVYLVYLVGYFVATACAVIYSYRKKSAENSTYTLILAMAVFINIGVWFVEQLVKIDFEILSVSYIISELFLLGLNMLVADNGQKAEPTVIPDLPPVAEVKAVVSEELLEMYKQGLTKLTKTEKCVYDAYVEGKSTKEIMGMLNIKENTLKFHNKNIYGKLGVSSRKQLVEIARVI